MTTKDEQYLTKQSQFSTHWSWYSKNGDKAELVVWSNCSFRIVHKTKLQSKPNKIWFWNFQYTNNHEGSAKMADLKSLLICMAHVHNLTFFCVLALRGLLFSRSTFCIKIFQNIHTHLFLARPRSEEPHLPKRSNFLVPQSTNRKFSFTILLFFWNYKNERNSTWFWKETPTCTSKPCKNNQSVTSLCQSKSRLEHSCASFQHAAC